MRILIELAAEAIEAFAVAIIVIAIAHGSVRYVVHLRQQVENAYEQYKAQVGKALLLGLEPNLQNVLILGLLVIIRTFLSWSLVVEIEGHWPWRRKMDTE